MQQQAHHSSKPPIGGLRDGPPLEPSSRSLGHLQLRQPHGSLINAVTLLPPPRPPQSAASGTTPRPHIGGRPADRLALAAAAAAVSGAALLHPEGEMDTTMAEASCSSGSATSGSWFGAAAEPCGQWLPPSTPPAAAGVRLRKCASTPTLHSMSAACGEGEGMEVFVALRAFKVRASVHGRCMDASMLRDASRDASYACA